MTTERQREMDKARVHRYLSTPRGRVTNIVKNIRIRAKANNLEMDIDNEFVYQMYLNQDGKCALSGIGFTTQSKQGRTPFSMSVDRIDSDKGYTKDNVRLVCSMANFAKNIWTDEDLYLFCKEVVKQKEKQK